VVVVLQEKVNLVRHEEGGGVLEKESNFHELD